MMDLDLVNPSNARENVRGTQYARLGVLITSYTSGLSVLRGKPCCMTRYSHRKANRNVATCIYSKSTAVSIPCAYICLVFIAI